MALSDEDRMVLELDTLLHFNFLQETAHKMLTQESQNVQILCNDGGIVSLNKTFLSLHSPLMMDMFKEFPGSETVSILIPASKEEVNMLLEILMGRKVISHEKEVIVNVIEIFNIVFGADKEIEVREKPKIRPLKLELTDNHSGSKQFGNPNLNKLKQEFKRLTEISEDKKYPCSMCGKAFTTSYNLSNHEVVHTKIKNHECPQCGRKFGTKSILYNHEKTHNKEKCALCDKFFSSKLFYSRHLQKHNLLDQEMSTYVAISNLK